MKTRFRNFITRLVLSAYMPRSLKVVVLTIIGLWIATTALGAIELVSGSPGTLFDPCCPWDCNGMGIL